MFYEDSFYQYLALERRFSPHTLAAYRRDLSQFIAFLDSQQVDSVAVVRHGHIRAWIVQQMQAGQSPRSINRRLSCLKSYFRLLRKRRLIEHDPLKKVVAPRTGKRLPVFVPEQQVNHLFTRVDFPADYAGQRDRLILEMLYATGLRRSELSLLKINDIDLGRFVLRVQGKGGKERIVPFAHYLARLIEQYLSLREKSFPGAAEPWLLLNRKGARMSPESIYSAVHKYLSMVTTTEQRSPHVLRHSFATHLSDHGADINAIKELLGHANLAATQIYTHNSIEKLKKVYDQAHPKSKEDEP
ncbi:MAG: tyrosine-type recombinase/integrase [Saprospiraceae bacterium]|nr:tyrosine-type recombinase/integrase [Saprospiraceae bacterium]